MDLGLGCPDYFLCTISPAYDFNCYSALLTGPSVVSYITQNPEKAVLQGFRAVSKWHSDTDGLIQPSIMRIFGPYSRNKTHYVIIDRAGERRAMLYRHYLMEQKLGEPLAPDEDVDVIQGSKYDLDDLRPDNLRVVKKTSRRGRPKKPFSKLPAFSKLPDLKNTFLHCSTCGAPISNPSLDMYERAQAALPVFCCPEHRRGFRYKTRRVKFVDLSAAGGLLAVLERPMIPSKAIIQDYDIHYDPTATPKQLIKNIMHVARARISKHRLTSLIRNNNRFILYGDTHPYGLVVDMDS